jgi:phosphomannomutase / phosphoglucomutase
VGEEINLMGGQAFGLGFGLGTLLHERGGQIQIVTTHDYCSNSASVKVALVDRI